MTIKGTSFLDPSCLVQLLSGSIHLKQHQLGTKKNTVYRSIHWRENAASIPNPSPNFEKTARRIYKSYVHRIKTLIDKR